MTLTCFSILSVLLKNTPRFLTHETSLTTVPSKERRQSEKSFTRCLGAKTINPVLSWFSFNVTLSYDTIIWHYHMTHNMTLPYDTTIWHYHMTLQYDITIWHYYMTLQYGKEPFETTIYSAVTIKVKWKISRTEIPLGCIAYHFEEKDILHRFRHVVAF